MLPNVGGGAIEQFPHLHGAAVQRFGQLHALKPLARALVEQRNRRGARTGELLRLVREQPDRTLTELRDLLRGVGVHVCRARVCQVLGAMGLRRKKTLHALERDREEMQRRRREFLDAIAATAPDRLVFLDESGVTTRMTRACGRATRGQRIPEATPGCRWEVLTTLGALDRSGMRAAMTIPEATDGDIFQAFLVQVLGPKLRPGDLVIMDNLGAHRMAAVSRTIEALGAHALYLPPYSPDLNPIEQAWSKFKQHLRGAKARTAEALDAAVTQALQSITGESATAWFRHCGYGLQQS